MHLNHHTFLDIDHRALVLTLHLQNRPKGTKCDNDSEGQRSESYSKCSKLIFGFYILALEHACIGIDMCSYIINHLEQKVTLTFYHVNQMSIKRAQTYLNYYKLLIGDLILI